MLTGELLELIIVFIVVSIISFILFRESVCLKCSVCIELYL